MAAHSAASEVRRTADIPPALDHEPAFPARRTRIVRNCGKSASGYSFTLSERLGQRCLRELTENQLHRVLAYTAATGRLGIHKFNVSVNRRGQRRRHGAATPCRSRHTVRWHYAMLRTVRNSSTPNGSHNKCSSPTCVVRKGAGRPELHASVANIGDTRRASRIESRHDPRQPRGASSLTRG